MLMGREEVKLTYRVQKGGIPHPVCVCEESEKGITLGEVVLKVS